MLLGCAVVAVVVVAVWQDEREPSYQGKTLSQWAEIYEESFRPVQVDDDPPEESADRREAVEAAAGAVADAILARFAEVTAVRVTVHKPHAPIAATFADVGVTIARVRHG